MNEDGDNKIAGTFRWVSSIAAIIGFISSVATLVSASNAINVDVALFSLETAGSFTGRLVESSGTFLSENKFEVTSVCGLITVGLYLLRKGTSAFSSDNVGNAIIAFFAGASLPAGVVFIIAPFAPNSFDILVDFREFVLASGVALLIVALTGIKSAIGPN